MYCASDMDALSRWPVAALAAPVDAYRSLALACAEVFENRAVGTVISATGLDQSAQRDRHLLGCLDTGIEKAKVALGERPHFAAGAGSVAPEREQLANGLNGKSECPSALDEAKLVDIDLAVGAIAVAVALGRSQKVDHLVVPYRFRRHAGLPRRITNTNHFGPSFPTLTFQLLEAPPYSCRSSNTTEADERSRRDVQSRTCKRHEGGAPVYRVSCCFLESGQRMGSTANLDAGPMASLVVGDHPAHVVIEKDGARAFVILSGENALAIIDLKRNAIVRRIATGRYPHGLRISPDGGAAYVANVHDESVSLIDTVRLTETAKIPVGQSPVQVGFTPDGMRAYVSLRDENKVAVIDTKSRSVIARVDVGRNPIQVHATADGRFVYVANQGTTADPDNTVSVIETATHKVVATIRTGAGAHGVAISNDGRFVFIRNIVAGTVSVIDTESRAVVDTFKVGGGPNGITYRRGPTRSVHEKLSFGANKEVCHDYPEGPTNGGPP